MKKSCEIIVEDIDRYVESIKNGDFDENEIIRFKVKDFIKYIQEVLKAKK